MIILLNINLVPNLKNPLISGRTCTTIFPSLKKFEKEGQERF
jgi:hypothetical protein